MEEELAYQHDVSGGSRMIRHFTRAVLYFIAGKAARLGDIMDDEQWLAHHAGRVVKVTRHGVSTLGRN